MNVPHQQTEGTHAEENEDKGYEDLWGGGNDGEGLGSEDSLEEIDAAHFGGFVGLDWESGGR